MEANVERASERYQDHKSHVGWAQRMPQGKKTELDKGRRCSFRAFPGNIVRSWHCTGAAVLLSQY